MLFVVNEALEGAAVERWSRRLTEAAARRPDLMILDLRGCPRVDAAAIELLLQMHGLLLRCGGRLVLRGPGDRVRRTLTLARVDQVLEVDDARPDPARPDPGRPDPARPDPGRPDPARPDPARPGPVAPAGVW